MKHHVCTVMAALVLLVPVLGCGGFSGKTEPPKKAVQYSKDQKPVSGPVLPPTGK
jgi:hypothetical protein